MGAYIGACTYACSPLTKVISLSDDAYRRLKTRKVPGESFSDVVVRLTSERRLASVLGLAGSWEGGDAESILAELRKQRKSARTRETNI